jgi:hypothetical protein
MHQLHWQEGVLNKLVLQHLCTAVAAVPAACEPRCMLLRWAMLLLLLLHWALLLLLLLLLGSTAVQIQPTPAAAAVAAA